MKALYDHGDLNRVDVVSTVSGGGYAWYWLISQNEGAQPFGSAVFSRHKWPRKSSELQATANFVPYPLAAPYLVAPPIATARMYERQLVRFAHSKYDAQKDEFSVPRWPIPLEEAINVYQDEIRKRTIPYFIVNTTLKTPRERGAKVVEITPHYIGNDTFDYHHWRDGQTPEILQTAQTFEMSGAAVRQKLAQKVPDYINNTTTKMTLYDGGGGGEKGAGENLGAYALIRRGIPNIVIVDAEHDPGYTFPAYRDLQKLLKKRGDDICFKVPDIDKSCSSENDVKTGYAFKFSKGSATGTTWDGRIIDCKITYIKMCRPTEWFEPVTGEGRSRMYNFKGADHTTLAERDELIFEENSFGRKRRNGRPLTVLDDFAKKHELKTPFYKAVVKKYASYLSFRPGFGVRAMRVFQGGAGEYTFPQTTTGDQSYYSDQFEALVGLGYLQAAAALDSGATVR